MRERFTDVATRLLEDDRRVAIVLADIGAERFAAAAARHPGRVVNVGIREQLLIGVAGGMALSGMRPIVHSYTPFLVERPFEQVKLDLGHQDVGAVLVSIGGSYDTALEGRTHQAPGDVALLSTLPGWGVVVPGHADEVERALRAAAATDERVYIRLAARSNRVAVDTGDGRIAVLRRGTAATVLAVGPMLDPVLAATQDLDVTILYASTVRPFDGAGLRAAVTTPSVALVEPYLAGTSAAQVSEALLDRPHRLLALGVPNVEHRHYGTAAEHDAAHGLDPAGIRRSLERLVA
jgi:transketolase